MKRKASLIIATLVISSSALAAKADFGYHILNSNFLGIPVTFDTKNPTGCPNIAFPTPITAPAGAMSDPNSDNRINITGKPTNEVCSTRYSDADSTPGLGCTVDVVIDKAGQTVVSASGNCKMDPAGVNVILNSGS